MTWSSPAHPTNADGMVVLGYFTMASESVGVIALTVDPRSTTVSYVDAAERTHAMDPVDLGRVDLAGTGLGFTACGVEEEDPNDLPPIWPEDPNPYPPGRKRPIITAMFMRGVVLLPPGQILPLPVGEVLYGSPILDSLLTEHDAISIGKTHPTFTDADRTLVTPMGDVVTLTDLSEIYTITLPDTTTADALAADLRSMPPTYFADVEITPTPTARVEPNDELFPDQWHLNNTGQEIPNQIGTVYGTPGADIDATRAWAYTTGAGGGQRLLIVDVSFNDNHVDLTGRLLPPPWSDPYEVQLYAGHGEAVAGVAGANTNLPLGEGIAGVDWHSDLVSIWNRLDACRKHDRIRFNIREAYVRGQRVVHNHSYAGFNANIHPCDAIGFKDEFMMGAVAVVAMGNHSNQFYPAKAENVIAVGCTDWDDEPSSHQTGAWMDLSAPGREILTLGGDGCDAGPCDDYHVTSGSSVAAPMVTGTVSLMYSRRPGLYPDDVEEILKRSADDIPVVGEDPVTGHDPESGYGRLNARRALAFLSAPYDLVQGFANGSSGSVVDTVHIPEFTHYHSISECNWPCDANATVPADRFELQVTATFPTQFAAGQVIGAWGRGMATDGWNDTNPNYAAGWCEVVAGSIDTTAATFTLRTYAYLRSKGC